MRELTGILRQGTAAIGQAFFLLPIRGGDPVYRERIYSYELYHQMRRQWPTNSAYCLNGEVDKSRHPDFSNIKKVPDLLVHQAGSDRYNHAVIEIKSAKSIVSRNVEKDLRTLSLFKQHTPLHYDRAIYLIYGDNEGADTLAKLQRWADKIPCLASIEVWLHRAVGAPAELVCVLSAEPALSKVKPS